MRLSDLRVGRRRGQKPNNKWYDDEEKSKETPEDRKQDLIFMTPPGSLVTSEDVRRKSFRVDLFTVEIRGFSICV